MAWKPAQAIQSRPARLLTSMYQPHSKFAGKAVPLPAYFREGTHDGDGYHTLNVARRDALGELLMPCRLPYNGGTVSCPSPAKGELNGKRVSVWIVSYQLANDQVSCGKAYQSTEVWQNKLAKVQEAILWMFATSCQNGVLTYYCSTEDPRCESVRRKKQKTSD